MIITKELFYSIKETYTLKENKKLTDIFNSINDILSKKNKRHNSWFSAKPTYRNKVFKHLDDKKGSIVSNLNKLSSTNFDKLSDIILKECEDHSLYEYTLINIFNIAIIQHTYCSNYVKLATLLVEKQPELKILIENKTVEFKTINESSMSKNNSNLSYDEFCDNNKLKLTKIGYSKFIGELYLKNLIQYDALKANLLFLIDNLNNYFNTESIDLQIIEDSIICLNTLLRTIASKLNLSELTYSKTHLESFITNTKLTKRLKFKLMDLKDYLITI